MTAEVTRLAVPPTVPYPDHFGVVEREATPENGWAIVATDLAHLVADAVAAGAEVIDTTQTYPLLTGVDAKRVTDERYGRTEFSCTLPGGRYAEITVWHDKHLTIGNGVNWGAMGTVAAADASTYALMLLTASEWANLRNRS